MLCIFKVTQNSILSIISYGLFAFRWQHKSTLPQSLKAHTAINIDPLLMLHWKNNVFKEVFSRFVSLLNSKCVLFQQILFHSYTIMFLKFIYVCRNMILSLKLDFNKIFSLLQHLQMTLLFSTRDCPLFLYILFCCCSTAEFTICSSDWLVVLLSFVFPFLFCLLLIGFQINWFCFFSVCCFFSITGLQLLA